VIVHQSYWKSNPSADFLCTFHIAKNPPAPADSPAEQAPR
jgi:hypothetical protein